MKNEEKKVVVSGIKVRQRRIGYKKGDKENGVETLFLLNSKHNFSQNRVFNRILILGKQWIFLKY